MEKWEMPKGYTDEEGVLEASRCLSCKVPRCETGCPTSMRIRDFIKEIKNGNLEGASEIIYECSSLPSICSIVCPHEKQCEGHCILNVKEKPIHCGALERYVVERVKPAYSIEKKNSLKVAIVGAGPAGISCAMELAKKGTAVEIYEASDAFGGVLASGIPSYRLSLDKVHEIEQEVKALGIVIHFHCSLKEQQILDLKQKVDAVFIGIGLPLVKSLGIPGETIDGVYNALAYLKQVNDFVKFKKGALPALKGTTVVIGAGNVAMDAARCALREGSKVIVAYRRSRIEAPASQKEIQEAEQEGIIFKFLSAPAEVIGKNQVEGLKVEKMELGQPDASGRKRPVGTGEYEIISCDQIISAIGQNPADIYDAKQLSTDHLYLSCDEFRTNVSGIYAGGDIVLGAKTVVEAMVCGRKAAQLILKDLQK